MIIEQIVYDASTGESRIEQIEVEEVSNDVIIPVPTLDERVSELELSSIDVIATNWDIDYRVCEIEWFLEDTVSVSKINFNKLGGTTMALSRYEQAKIMILGGVYDDAKLRRQLNTYLDRNYLTQEEYDELIALMDARLLVEGK